MAKKETKPVVEDGQGPVLLQGKEGMEDLDLPKDPQTRPEGTADNETLQVQQPSPELENSQQGERTDSGKPPVFRITCRNKISKVIGGVSFVNGVGYTSDGFTASWFGNKDGYEVKKAGT